VSDHQCTAVAWPSGLIVILSDGRQVGSWRRTRWLRRLVPYDVRTPAWTRDLARRAPAAMRDPRPGVEGVFVAAGEG
jgi:hypothetical protein